MIDSDTVFKIKSAFQLTGRQFFILGDILSGTIKKGMTADMSSIGINKKFIIEAIEFALHRDGDKVWEDVSLGFSGLTEPEKQLLKTQAPFATPISINEKNGS
jgi:hypothetical protein